MKKLPVSYSFDYLITREAKDKSLYGMGFLEIKIRSCASTDYEDFCISFLKLDHGVRWLYLGMDVVFAVRWKDKDGYVKLTDARENYQLVWGGRNDRGDAADKEPLALIPINIFKEF